MSAITKETRLDSYLAILETHSKRIADVLDIFLDNLDRDYTAEEVAEELFIRGKVKVLERNTSAPRLTYMEQAGILEVVGKRKSTMSGKNVAVYRLKDVLV